METEPNNATATPQPDRRMTLSEIRKLVAKVDYWRPDAVETRLQILTVDGEMRAGNNKWGRVQVYATARLETGQTVTLCMSRRCTAQLFATLDEQGFDQDELTQLWLAVSRVGRGLETNYSWAVVEAPSPKPVAAGSREGVGRKAVQKATVAPGKA